ncbi:hypothetical protein, partial [Oscillibacter sp.]|uniref:hypothetical protein n=1 Tax=Oscillibacter sp. TaxID=1945593 RepID=UPI0028A12008
LRRSCVICLSTLLFCSSLYLVFLIYIIAAERREGLPSLLWFLQHDAICRFGRAAKKKRDSAKNKP